ncbi:MAG TPA: hypothetical protein VHP33_22630, partial [Polyangiaceae bacterium]|nr:hypothetical protein [Polyangiaceae bacterium]
VSLCLACGSSTPGESMSSAGSGSSGAGTVGGGGQPSSSGAGGGGAAQAGAAGAVVTAAGTGGQATAGAAGSGAGSSPGGSTSGGTGGSAAVQPPDGVPAGYKLVYAQTFAEPASLADLVFANPTQWKHDPAGFVASTGASYAPPFRSPFSVAIVKSIKVTSFVMDAEMLQTSPDGDAHRDMVFIWNFSSPSKFYYSHISTAHDGVAHNILIVNEADRKAISTTFSAGYDWGRNVWKKLRVVRDVESGAMSVFDLDAPTQAILTANDKTFTDGYVGFGSFDNSGQVRNVKVWAATSAPGAPDFFAP